MKNRYGKPKFWLRLSAPALFIKKIRFFLAFLAPDGSLNQVLFLAFLALDGSLNQVLKV